VFDPLAVTLVIAFNTALKVDEEEKLLKKVEENKEKKNFDLYNDESSDEDNEGSDIYTEDDFKDWDVTLTDGLEDEDWNEEEVENFNEQFQEIKSEEETNNQPADEFANLKQDFSRRGVDLDGDGTIDGYDTNGDGLIDEPAPASSRRAQYAMIQKPYYARPDFDWNDKRRWINDQNAVNYWFTHIRDKQKYPTDFDSKTY
jgi:hypothetical protein